MMDKKPHIKPYIYGMLAGFGAISLSILFFFFIYRFDGFGDAVSTMTGILMPFIYGAVIAYLLKPVCNTIENFLHRVFPQKMHGLANMLAIAATLLFGILVVYALVMMVVPQVISSVTSLYYTAQTSIARFMRWVNTQDVFLDNATLMGYFNDAYDAITSNLASLRTTLLPSLQNLQGILSSVGAGQAFAETYALCGDVMMVDAVAAEECEVLFVNISAFSGGAPGTVHEKLLRNLLTVSMRKNLSLSQRIFCTTPKTVRGRLLTYFSAQAARSGSLQFEIPFNRQQLADYLNLDRSALSKELCKMRDEGLLTFEKNRFALNELPE